MLAITLPIPRSISSRVRNATRGSAIDLLWKVLVTVVLLAIVGATATLGTIGAVIAFGIMGALISEDVRRAVSDLYNRRFTEVTVNLRSFGNTLLFWR